MAGVALDLVGGGKVYLGGPHPVLDIPERGVTRDGPARPAAVQVFVGDRWMHVEHAIGDVARLLDGLVTTAESVGGFVELFRSVLAKERGTGEPEVPTDGAAGVDAPASDDVGEGAEA